MSLTASFSITHPLSVVVYGPRADAVTQDAEGKLHLDQRGTVAYDNSQEILGRLGMKDNFSTGTLPEANDVNEFFKAWLPSIAEKINQSGSDALVYHCPACGDVVQLQVAADDNMELEPPVTDELLDEDEFCLEDTVTVSAALTPSTCPHEECGAELDETPDGKIDLGLFDL